MGNVIALEEMYAVFTADDTDPEKVRERADEDMYRNKKAMKQS